MIAPFWLPAFVRRVAYRFITRFNKDPNVGVANATSSTNPRSGKNISAQRHSSMISLSGRSTVMSAHISWRGGRMGSYSSTLVATIVLGVLINRLNFARTAAYLLFWGGST